MGPSRAAIYNKRTETLGRRNQDLRCEVLTQKATAELFGTTEAAARHAIRSGSVDVELRVSPSLAGRTASLLELDSVRDCWCHQSPDDVEAQLEHMRRDHLVLAASSGVVHDVLHTEPLLDLAGAMDLKSLPEDGAN